MRRSIIGRSRNAQLLAIGALCAPGLIPAALGQSQKIPEFEPAAVYSAGWFPWGIAAGDALGPPEDINVLDGYPEIAVAVGQLNLYNGAPGAWTGATGEVLVFRNTQDWADPNDGLQQAQVIVLDDVHANTIAADVVWADMDGDGRLDLVITGTTHFDSGYADGAWGIYVYEYVGGANPFAFLDYEPTTYPVRGLTVADFDDDGDLDVAAAGDLLDYSLDRDYIFVVENDGTGHLLPEVVYGLGESEEATAEVVSGLFDKTPGGGTLPDLFTTRWGIGDGASMTSTGTGFSTTIVTPACEWAFTDMGVGRFTSGKLSDDIVGMGVDGLLHVLHGDGEAGFGYDCSGTEPDDVYLENGAPYLFLPRGVAVGHLNGGTKPDIVIAPGGDTAIFVLGKGDGKFQHDSQEPLYYPDLGTVERALRVTVADLDQDGFGDIITSNHGTISNVGTISVLINKFELITLP